ncbi:hypothetical protein BS47DRAFT_1356848 [Hydnum rufescens UP504]|uniref:Uncharacterized protein n=1 Tax=Hydnum rufescens UP504 TaxID=1448309 RepID=A0A9P6AAD3_9AGAM|nr:hypothetical protein BS47DRAFT_1356848 [Hydnum rufescens UP504]
MVRHHHPSIESEDRVFRVIPPSNSDCALTSNKTAVKGLLRNCSAFSMVRNWSASRDLTQSMIIHRLDPRDRGSLIRGTRGRSAQETDLWFLE